MDSNRIPISASDAPENTREQLQSVVTPVGPYRFLTRIDLIQEGDLFRNVGTEEVMGPFNTNWSPVTERLHGHSPDSYNEYIRPLEHAFAVPTFDIT